MAGESIGASPESDIAAVFDLSTEMGRAYAQVDWAATSLGPISTWSASLRNSIRLMLKSRFSMWMGWGPDRIFFCNATYRADTLGKKYPWALGRPLHEVWSEIWDDVRPRVDAVMNEGISTWDEALLLFLERNGYAEETYHTFSYSPLTDDDASIAGVFCVVSEDTGRVVSERRITTLRDLGGGLAGAHTEADVQQAAYTQLATDPYNLPFASAYRVEGDTAHRMWAIGIDPAHPAAPASIDLTVDVDQAGRRFDDGSQHTVPLAGRYDDLPTGGWHDPPSQAQVVPLRLGGEATVDGFLVVGLNPHRPLDEDYIGFLDLLAGQISAASGRARIFEFERLRAEQIAELDRAKTTFFTNVSHELRTPLTLLLGPTEDLLAETEPASPQHHQLEVVHRNAERLLKLVNTLLDFSRLEAGRLQAQFEPVDLGTFTRELASMFTSAAARAGLSLHVDCGPSASEVFIDREMWAKIVLNLLSNALKATFDGGITVSVRVDGDGARLEVTDTGVGVPAEELGRLFDRFHRVTGASLRTHEGSGIGLALVAELAALHGGEVSVRSEVGTGSTFTVTVPAGSRHLPADSVSGTGRIGTSAEAYGAGYVSEAMRWIDAAAAADDTADSPVEQAGDDPRHLVLVADDNADMREYIGTLLAEQYRVVTAADGAVALELAGRLLPDLVLTDVMMPNLDGFGLLSALRTSPATMHIPVVMLSARAGDEAAAEGIETGADDYLAKPFSARELRARVGANLELDRVRRLVDELERNRDMLAMAEELAVIGSYEHDIASGHVTGSAQFRRLLGVSAAELAGNGYDAAMGRVHPEDLRGLETRVQHTITTGEPLEAECRIVDVTGAARHVWITGAIERAPDGTSRRMRGSVQDITDRRRAEVASAVAAAAREGEAREHEIAMQLQSSLLPRQSFDADHLEIAGHYQAGVEGTVVGGDWYDVIDLDAGRTALVLGDVMGRGVRAAAVMGQLRATIRAYARLDVAPDLLLHLLDSAVREISDDTIVTCVYGVYDPADRTFTYANAGHLPPLFTVPGGGTTRLTSGGPPLGTGRTWAKPETVTLPVGAMLTLYTDGLVEDRVSPIDDGIDALADLVAVSDGSLETLPSRLVAALRPEGTEDDIAVLVSRVAERSAFETSERRQFAADVDVARLARDFVVTLLPEWGVPAATVSDAQLIVSELATNAYRHGSGPVDVGLRRAGDRLFVDVCDTGSSSPRMRHPGTDDDGGRGLLIISMLAERWGTRETPTGKSVWALLRLPDAARADDVA